MANIRSGLVAFIAIVLSSVVLSTVDAQDICAPLQGKVFDSGGWKAKPKEGVVLPGVLVTISNENSGNTNARKTNDNGSYRFPCLPPGYYTITADLTNFDQRQLRFKVLLIAENVIQPHDISLQPRTAISSLLMPGSTESGTTDTPDFGIRAGSRVNRQSGQVGLIWRTSPAFSKSRFSGFEIELKIGESARQGFHFIPASLRMDLHGAPPGDLPLPPTPPKKKRMKPPPPAQQDEARAQLVHTVDITRASNFSQQQIVGLPIGGAAYMRSFDELALLVPGISPPPFTPGARGPGVGFGIGTAGEFSSNGMRARSNNFSIDGSDNNDPDVGVRRQGFVALVPQSLESINELSIATLLWDAEVGRNFGAQVNAVSKYGEQSLHGELYGFFTDSRLNARNAFDFDGGGASGGKDPFTRSQTGFVLSGPLIGKRTQFLASYEHLAVNASSEQHFSVPMSDERRFQGLSRFTVTNFFFPTLSFNVLTGVTPLGRRLLSFYPLPNNPGGPYGANTYTEVLPADGRGNVASFRITRLIKEANVLNARYNFTDDSRVLPSIDQAIRSTIGSHSRSQNLSLVFDAQIRESLFNQSRFSLGRTTQEFPEHPDGPLLFASGGIENVDTSTGPQPALSSTGPIGELIIEPYSRVGINALLFPQSRVNNTFQYADVLYWQTGRHSVKLGIEIRRLQLNSRQDRLYRPLVVFGNGVITRSIFDSLGRPIASGPARFFPGIELATLGLPSYVLQTIAIDTPDSTIGLRSTDYHLSIKDSYRMRENLTLNAGLRYEYNSVPAEVNHRIEDALMLKGFPVERLLSSGPQFFGLADRIKAYREIVDGRRHIYEPDLNNLGPQVGLAWDPAADGKMAIRGGYGIYYDAILGAVVSQSRNVFPKEIPINTNYLDTFFLRLNNPPVDAAVANTFPFVSLIKRGTLNQLANNSGDLLRTLGALFEQSTRVGGGLSFTLPGRHLRTPYAQHWHLTVEREVFADYFLSLAYVGTKGTKLTRLVTPNLGPYLTPDLPFVSDGDTPEVFEGFSEGRPLRRPNPNLGAYEIIENSASSTYHALQIEARKHYNHRYMFTLAYTWSHAIDDVSDLLPIAGAPVLAQQQFNLRSERGNASFDIRHRLAASVIWDIPFCQKSRHVIARVLRDWQAAAIFQANTGQPFTLNLPLDANQDGNLTDRPLTTEGLTFFTGHGSRRVALATGRTIDDFFRFGEDGPVGRNTLTGDSFVNLDLSLTRSLQLGDRKKLELRSEFFNLLNRANFGLPIRVLGAPGFGSSVDTINSARVIQLAVKFQF